MIGEYEQSLREQAIAARRRLYGKPDRVVRLSAPPADIMATIAIPPPKPSPMPGARIIAEVAKKHGVTVREIKSKARHDKIAKIRHEAAFRLIIELGMSYHQTARLLGGRDHSTAINSLKKHAQTSPATMAAYERHFEREKAKRAKQRAEAIRLHFDEGLSAGRASGCLGIPRSVVVTWLRAEAARREVSPTINSDHRSEAGSGAGFP